MVRAARLRNKVLTTLNHDYDTMTSIPDLLSLVVETQLIDEDLSNWATSLTEDWLFTIHAYTSHGNRRHVGRNAYIGTPVLAMLQYTTDIELLASSSTAFACDFCPI